MASPSNRITPYEVSRTSGHATANGTAHTRIDLRFANQPAIILVPDRVQDRTDITLVLHCHGYVDTAEHVLTARMKTTADGMLDRGWVIASHEMHGNNWGGPDAINDLQDTYHWAAHQWHVKKVILHGFSMGAMPVYNTISRKALPDIAAAITVNGVVDVQANPDWYESASAVYGGMTIEEMQTYQAGYDPARDDPHRWAGTKIFIVGGTSDTVVPPALHMQPFIARAATPDTITYLEGDHGHLQGFHATEALAWADTYAPQYSYRSARPSLSSASR